MGYVRQLPHHANEEEILRLVEAAVAAREAKASLSANPEGEMEQGAANENGEHHAKDNRSKVSSAAMIDRSPHFVRRVQILPAKMREMTFNLYHRRMTVRVCS